MTRIQAVAATATLALTLSACGGGGDEQSAVDDSLPAPPATSTAPGAPAGDEASQQFCAAIAPGIEAAFGRITDTLVNQEQCDFTADQKVRVRFQADTADLEAAISAPDDRTEVLDAEAFLYSKTGDNEVLGPVPRGLLRIAPRDRSATTADDLRAIHRLAIDFLEDLNDTTLDLEPYQALAAGMDPSGTTSTSNGSTTTGGGAGEGTYVAGPWPNGEPDCDLTEQCEPLLAQATAICEGLDLQAAVGNYFSAGAQGLDLDAVRTRGNVEPQIECRFRRPGFGMLTVRFAYRDEWGILQGVSGGDVRLVDGTEPPAYVNESLVTKNELNVRVGVGHVVEIRVPSSNGEYPTDAQWRDLATLGEAYAQTCTFMPCEAS